MENSDYKISLDLLSMSAPVSLSCRQGDTGRRICITLTEDGTPYEIASGCYAVFAGKKPDNTILWNGCTIEGNTIIYELTDQTVAVVGWVPVQIRLYGANGKLITSPDFVLLVDEPVVRDAAVVAESANEITALTQLIGEAAALMEEMRDFTDGKSAYEIALENGFEGTEKEWLDSLKGEQGPAGATGPQGPQGNTGAAGADGGYYTPKVTQPTTTTMKIEHTPSKAGMPAVTPVTVNLPVGTGNGSSPNGNGLSTEQINALDGMFKVCAFIKDDVSAEYNAFCTAFGIEGGGDSGGGEDEPDEPITPTVTLSSISATYSGGDVAVGTVVTDLTGIVVTAHYSDGTSKTVTGYTLSGTIAEGSNTVTVTYQGKSTTFTVTGVAESGGGDIVATWESGVPYVKNVVDNEYVEKNGTITTYNNWSRTDYLNCYGASKIVYSGVTYPGGYNVFYDEDKKFISNFEALAVTEDSEVVVPDNAVYVVFSSMTSSVHSMVITPYA